MADEEDNLDDPAYQKAVFEQAYAQTCQLLETGEIGGGSDADLRALRLIHQGRNQAIDEVAADYALSRGAACASGCSSCCHQMVLCTPFEIFDLARHILDSKSAIEIAKIKERLAALVPLPLDEQSRLGSDKPCALLENNSCSIYEHRPSLCRTMLSISRVACETSLNSREQTIPFIAEPVIISFLMQLGIDYALIKHRHVSTEKVEMSRALSAALDNYDAAFTDWAQGNEAFSDCQVGDDRPSNADLVGMAAMRSGIG